MAFHRRMAVAAYVFFAVSAAEVTVVSIFSKLVGVHHWLCFTILAALNARIGYHVDGVVASRPEAFALFLKVSHHQ